MKKEFFMNYAEGQQTPTYKFENEEKAKAEAERLAEKLGVPVTTLKAVDVTQPKDITQRVKTYADACAVLGVEPVNDEELAKLGFTKDEIAYRKLKTIAEALNEGWVADFSDSSTYKYWPWFIYYGASAGLSCALTYSAASYTDASIGSRLCYKTRKLAAFAGSQFIDLYNDFLLRK